MTIKYLLCKVNRSTSLNSSSNCTKADTYQDNFASKSRKDRNWPKWDNSGWCRHNSDSPCIDRTKSDSIRESERSDRRR